MAGREAGVEKCSKPCVARARKADPESSMEIALGREVPDAGRRGLVRPRDGREKRPPPARRHGKEQLVVLAPGKGQLERGHAERAGHGGGGRVDGNRRGIDDGPDGRCGRELADAVGQSVREVDRCRGQALATHEAAGPQPRCRALVAIRTGPLRVGGAGPVEAAFEQPQAGERASERPVT